MAIGLARMFGIRFPANFNSPYKATNIIAFWQRWHMTLTRYLTLYLYNPIALWVTRRRAAAGQPIARCRREHADRLRVSGGVSHDCHDVLGRRLAWGGNAVRHLWPAPRRLSDDQPRLAHLGPAPPSENPSPLYRAASVIVCVTVTYPAVLVGWVFFRAASSSDAARHSGGHGRAAGVDVGHKGHGESGRIEQIALPPPGARRLAQASHLPHHRVWSAQHLELLARYDPILGKVRTSIPTALQWRPTVPWGVAVGTVAAISVLLPRRDATEFLYFRF